ncbi:UNVERIFIED_ORG: protein-(glutamine-N5) methyltransferase, release factor-specific [Clostridioides difficile F501]
MNDIWTIQAALDWTVGYLERKGDENPRLSAQWLLSEATGLSRIELYANFEQPLSMGERDVLRAYVTRRGKGEPLQYITGEVGFRHITVKVRPGVLIPRPETEVLVSEALALLPAAPKRVAQHAWPEDGLPPVPWPEGEAGEQRPERTADQGVAEDESTPAVASGELAPEPPELLVADLCTGSGCIACSVAYEHPLARVVATDIVPEAVALARDNVAALELGDRVEVLACDLGEGVDPALMGAFDLVVSNPPYVPTAVMDDIPREVAEFEPALALDGGADGLDVLRRLFPWCRRALKEGGGFAFELHETCLDEAARLAEEAGFSDVRVTADLAGRPRVLTARKRAV